MKITVKDVAKHANVSPSSVSRYLNNPNSINAENAFRIKNAIDDLNYTPNPVARSLKSGRSNLIGVIVPSINSYFSLLCRAAISRVIWSSSVSPGKMAKKRSIISRRCFSSALRGFFYPQSPHRPRNFKESPLSPNWCW